MAEFFIRYKNVAKPDKINKITIVTACLVSILMLDYVCTFQKVVAKTIAFALSCASVALKIYVKLMNLEKKKLLVKKV